MTAILATGGPLMLFVDPNLSAFLATGGLLVVLSRRVRIWAGERRTT
ncbi:MAG: hypothetical protein AB7N24_02800 [Dehalococcoidia bacterium]